MKAIILAGGMGTRLSEETTRIPKPLVEIGGMPIIWHIMKMYSAHNIHDFIICCGYKGVMIKKFFVDYFMHSGDLSVDLQSGRVTASQNKTEPWQVTLADTGENTMTGGRLKRIRSYLEGETDFCMTYGDGVTNADLTALMEFHKSHGRLATVTAVTPPGRFGALALEDSRVTGMQEKPPAGQSWINGGFFVLSTKVLDLIEDDSTVWERGPMETLAETDQLRAFRHDGFWQPMDTLREKIALEAMWSGGSAPWKTW